MTLPVVAVPIPVLGRHPLLRYTISRLAKQEGVETRVICVGDTADRAVCEAAGALFYEHPNQPLGAKWQFGFTKAREMEPDAVLYLGSSDWVSHNWCATMLGYRKPMVGKRDVYCVDINPHKGIVRACYWPFYPPKSFRHQEAIGTGRLLHRLALDAANWNVFDPHLHNSLDYSMEQNVGHTESVDNPDLLALSLSTTEWVNKHQYAEMSGMEHVRTLSAAETAALVDTHFPEVRRIFSKE